MIGHPTFQTSTT